MLASNHERDLNSFARNINSQFGEDGIIEEILLRLRNGSEVDGWCVEFGAWDGKHLSNTYNLIDTKGYKAVLIEGDPARHVELCKNIPRSDVHKICTFVTFDGENTLDKILAKTPIPKDFDFLSIDIDGNDYFIFEGLTQFKPKLVCIEFNPTIPNDVEFIQPKDFKIKQGSAPKSLTALAKSKGYSLVATTLCNLFFVRDDFKEIVSGNSNTDLNALRDDSEYKTYLFIGFDGTILTNRRKIQMPWHGIAFKPAELQQLPRFLRRMSSDYNLPQKALFNITMALKRKFPLKDYISSKWKAPL